MRLRERGIWTFALMLAGLLSGPGDALADAIDGNWCSSDGKNMTIAGDSIVTPAGTATSGEYSRHAFSYTVPEGDPGPGRFVDMVLLGEDAVEIKVLDGPGGNAEGAAQVWIRCRPVVSLLM